jgi:large subunit ribosomal protein L13
MKTVVPKLKDVRRRWWIIDARGQVLGRVATRAAILLMGKHKPDYVPYMDVGDYVIVVNAREVVLTGRKEEKKVYYRHSGYPGGLKSVTAAQLRATHPERLVEWAVSGMLPKNRLRKVYLRKLKVYPDDRHPHQAQQPIPYPL